MFCFWVIGYLCLVLIPSIQAVCQERLHLTNDSTKPVELFAGTGYCLKYEPLNQGMVEVSKSLELTRSSNSKELPELDFEDRTEKLNITGIKQ